MRGSSKEGSIPRHSPHAHASSSGAHRDRCRPCPCTTGARKTAVRTRGRWLARLFGGGFYKLMDRIDAGLLEGGIDTTLPDGSHRILGGRKPGPMPIVRLHSWRALVRLMTSGSVGWYKAWTLGEWSSLDPVPLFDLFMRNGESLGAIARDKGWWRFVNRGIHYLRRNTIGRAHV